MGRDFGAWVTSLSPPTLALKSPHSRKWGATWEARDNSFAKTRKVSLLHVEKLYSGAGCFMPNVYSTKHGILNKAKKAPFATDSPRAPEAATPPPAAEGNRSSGEGAQNSNEGP